MSEIFVFSENVELAAKLINLGKGLTGSVSAVAVNKEDAEQLAGFGVDQVYLLDQAARIPAGAATLAELLKANNPALLLVGDTIDGRELAAMTASHLDVGLVSGAIAVEKVDGQYEATRMLYGGALLRTEILEALTVVTMAGGKLEAARLESENAVITPLVVTGEDAVKVIEVADIPHEGVDLNSADVIVGVGLGFDKREDLKLADALAAACHGAIGCTRPVAEDKKWLPAEQYIGISGANIHPSIYFAVGISGQVQHTVGTRDARFIVAINKNENAPIFKSADYGIVGDLYEVLPLLTKALKGTR